MCHRKDGLGAPSTALCPRPIEVFFNVPGHVCFSSPVSWEPAHQCNELLGGRTRLRLRQRRSQLRHDFVTHHDFDSGAGVFPYLAHQLRKPFACFTDRQFHGMRCTRVYKMSQPVCRGLRVFRTAATDRPVGLGHGTLCHQLQDPRSVFTPRSPDGARLPRGELFCAPRSSSNRPYLHRSSS